MANSSPCFVLVPLRVGPTVTPNKRSQTMHTAAGRECETTGLDPV